MNFNYLQCNLRAYWLFVRARNMLSKQINESASEYFRMCAPKCKNNNSGKSNRAFTIALNLKRVNKHQTIGTVHFKKANCTANVCI